MLVSAERRNCTLTMLYVKEVATSSTTICLPWPGFNSSGQRAEIMPHRKASAPPNPYSICVARFIGLWDKDSSTAQSSSLPNCKGLRPLGRAQEEALDFAGGGFRQVGDEAEFVGAFETDEAGVQPAVYFAVEPACGIS
jgi:hypothetical protein